MHMTIYLAEWWLKQACKGHLEEGGDIVLLIPRPPLYLVSCGADNGVVLEMRLAMYTC